MTPWWSKPTADEIPDNEPASSAASPAEEPAAEERPRRKAAEKPEPRDEETPAPPRSRRRTPRRRSAGAGSGEPSKGAKSDKSEKDEKSEREKKGEKEKKAAGETKPANGRKSGGGRAGGGGPKKTGAAHDGGKEEPKAAGNGKTDGEGRGERRAEERRRPAPVSEEAFDLSPAEIERMTREVVLSVPERTQSVNDERKIALFCDLENIALGVRDSAEVKKFDIKLVLERLLEKGKIIVKKAYCDWERYSDYKRPFHENAIELIDIPQKYYSGKNSADIKMVVDAMDLCYAKEHLDTFVLLSGDSDFSPLVSKLKENNKYVIGIGVKNSSANLLIDNCDEFIYYEDIWRKLEQAPQLEGLTKKQAEVFSLMIDAIQALIRENKDVLWGSMIKQTMQRKKPSFNEGYYGYSTFSELLEDAERKAVVKIKKDQRSGSYIVTGFAKRT